MPMSRCCFYLDFLMGWIMIMASMGMDCTLAKEMNTPLQLSGTALPTTRNLLCLYGIGIVQVLPNRGGKMGPLYPDVSQAAYEIAPNNGKVSCLCSAEVKGWRQTTNVEPCCLTNDSRWGGSCHSTCKKNITHWYLTLVAFKVISEEYCAYMRRGHQCDITLWVWRTAFPGPSSVVMNDTLWCNNCIVGQRASALSISQTMHNSFIM